MRISLPARVAVITAACLAIAGCTNTKKDSSGGYEVTKSKPVVQPSVGLQKRFGDEIVVAGNFYRIGTPVITWMDEDGYDAYRTSRHFAPFAEASYEFSAKQATTRAVPGGLPGQSDPGMTNPDRYGLRYGRDTLRATTRATTMPGGMGAYLKENFADPTTMPLSPEELEAVRNGGWTLPELQKRVDQFVLHYDVAGISSQCFKTLHDARGLSVHFMLDIDGTIYQTCDLKEATWHATKANSRSIGIEIANIGSYSSDESPAPLQQWYKKDENGKTFISVPERLGGQKATHIPGIYHPMRNDVVVGQIRGTTQRMYDLTPQQYASLIKLTAALGDVFPQIKLDYPRNDQGSILTRTLTDEEYDGYKGVLGHYHVQSNKSDPGVALQWDYLIDNARKELAARKHVPTLLARK